MDGNGGTCVCIPVAAKVLLSCFPILIVHDQRVQACPGKDGKMYYAFYAPQQSGKIPLRSERAYDGTDYVDVKDLGTVSGPAATLDVQFEKHVATSDTRSSPKNRRTSSAAR